MTAVNKIEIKSRFRTFCDPATGIKSFQILSVDTAAITDLIFSDSAAFLAIVIVVRCVFFRELAERDASGTL